MIAAFLWMPLMLAMEVQTPSDGYDTPDWLVGDWSGQGLLFGEPARMRLAVCPLAGHRGLTLDYQVRGESNAAVETGQTQYRLIAPGHLKVTDYVQRDGGRLESFASADYHHKTACPSLPDDERQ